MDNLKSGTRIALTTKTIKRMPSYSGVYMFCKKNKILYIGKALNIKARVLSHIENAKYDRKEMLILKKSNTIEYYLTDSEFKALILEARLIQTYHPKYNVRWRDDKSYLYLKITVKDAYPKVLITRRQKKSEQNIFGPFPSLKAVERILKQIRSIYPFCTQSKISNRVCFYAKIGLCNPCPNYISSLGDNKLKNTLQSQYHRNIQNAKRILEGNFKNVDDSIRKELRKLTLQKKYEQAIVVRNRFLNFKTLVEQQLFSDQDFSSYDRSSASLLDLKQILHNYLPSLKRLRRIECYDVSNLGSKESTGSMVVLINGVSHKNQYRKFKIKNPGSVSDFTMLEEVIRRRYKNKWTKPNLIVVDGGKPQVRSVLRVLSSLNIETAVIGIAKNPDRLIIGVNNLPTIRPNITRLGFNLIRSIRDESHRFAHKYHLKLRSLESS